jgi:hypothetical protein
MEWRVADWVAVRSVSASFTPVLACHLTCGANGREHPRTSTDQAFNPLVLGSSPRRPTRLWSCSL